MSKHIREAVAPSPAAVRGMLHPGSVAVIGASDDYSKFGGRIMRHLVSKGFEGTIYPINPARKEVCGIAAFADLASLPAPPDIALVALPAALLLATVEACGRAGVGVCVVVTAQLAEFSEEGAALERQMVAIARAHGMRIVGPNCMGLIVPPAKLALTSSATIAYADGLKSGGVALISQSGALMGSLFALTADHGIGLSAMVTIGNQADLELCDFLDAFVGDADMRVICLYIESIRSPRRFLDLVSAARRAGKQLLAVKAGRTNAGSALAQSHTASIAGSFEAFEAACRETGVVLLDDPESMILCAGVMADNPPAGKGGIGLVGSSGGGGAVLADRLALAGLPVAEWSAGTRQALSRDFLPAHQNNPLDLGAHVGALGPAVFERAVTAAFEDEGVAVFVYVMTPQPLMMETLEAVIALWKRRTKPVLLVLNMSRFGADIRARALEAGIPFVTRNDDGIRAMTALLAQRDLAASIRAPDSERPEGVALGAIETEAGFLTEPRAKAMLAACGVAVPQAVLCATVEEATRAAEGIGYPVVMKGVAENVVHKSDSGLVRVGVGNASEVQAAFEEMSARFPPGAPVLVDVQQMIGEGVELIVGARRDPEFGAQIVVGFGGIFVEMLKDVASARAPVSPAEAAALLRRLKLWPLLDGARSRAALDVDAASDAISRISWLAADLGDRLDDFEVNPLRITVSGAIALDARGTLAV